MGAMSLSLTSILTAEAVFQFECHYRKVHLCTSKSLYLEDMERDLSTY